MNEPSHNNKGHGHPPSPTKNSTVAWAAAIFILLVSLAISVLPRAFAQPGSRADNQARQSLSASRTPRLQHSSTLDRLQITKGGQPELLPSDRKRNSLNSSQLGFYY